MLKTVEENGVTLYGVTPQEFVEAARLARKHRLTVGDAHGALLARAHGEHGSVLTSTPQLYSGIEGLGLLAVDLDKLP